MSDLVYRVAMQGLVNLYEKDTADEAKEEKNAPAKSKAQVQSILMKALDLVKGKKIKNLDMFNAYLSESGVDQKSFQDAITDIVKGGDATKITLLGLFLGEGLNGSGIDLLKSTWWERNLPDEVLRKIIAPKWWPLFRDNKWIEENKVTKD
jgi:Flp pilus assembly protein CpaB